MRLRLRQVPWPVGRWGGVVGGGALMMMMMMMALAFAGANAAGASGRPRAAAAAADGPAEATEALSGTLFVDVVMVGFARQQAAVDSVRANRRGRVLTPQTQALTAAQGASWVQKVEHALLASPVVSGAAYRAGHGGGLRALGWRVLPHVISAPQRLTEAVRALATKSESTGSRVPATEMEELLHEHWQAVHSGYTLFLINIDDFESPDDDKVSDSDRSARLLFTREATCEHCPSGAGLSKSKPFAWLNIGSSAADRVARLLGEPERAAVGSAFSVASISNIVEESLERFFGLVHSDSMRAPESNLYIWHSCERPDVHECGITLQHVNAALDGIRAIAPRADLVLNVNSQHVEHKAMRFLTADALLRHVVSERDANAAATDAIDPSRWHDSTGVSVYAALVEKESGGVALACLSRSPRSHNVLEPCVAPDTPAGSQLALAKQYVCASGAHVPPTDDLCWQRRLVRLLYTELFNSRDLGVLRGGTVEGTGVATAATTGFSMVDLLWMVTGSALDPPALCARTTHSRGGAAAAAALASAGRTRTTEGDTPNAIAAKDDEDDDVDDEVADDALDDARASNIASMAGGKPIIPLLAQLRPGWSAVMIALDDIIADAYTVATLKPWIDTSSNPLQLSHRQSSEQLVQQRRHRRSESSSSSSSSKSESNRNKGQQPALPRERRPLPLDLTTSPAIKDALPEPLVTALQRALDSLAHVRLSEAWQQVQQVRQIAADHGLVAPESATEDDTSSSPSSSAYVRPRPYRLADVVPIRPQETKDTKGTRFMPWLSGQGMFFGALPGSSAKDVAEAASSKATSFYPALLLAGFLDLPTLLFASLTVALFALTSLVQGSQTHGRRGRPVGFHHHQHHR